MDDEYRFRELGQFLKARRARISPTQVGLPYGNRRRTPGLKREEVAQISNVSITWYTWMEQGRPIKVSEQVLASIGQALLLNEREMQYIFKLSQMTMTEIKHQESQLVGKPLQAILDKLEPFPSFASDQYWNVIGWNPSAKAIFGDFEKMNGRERNTIWRMFTNPEYKKLFSDWDKAAEWIVAQYRLACGSYLADEWFKKFVDELMAESSDFMKFWMEQNVNYEGDFRKRFYIQTVGEMIFDFTSLDLSINPHIKIAVHTPVDEETTEKLKKITLTV